MTITLPVSDDAQKKESIFIKNVLTEFFKNYDIIYANGTRSKIAFYCPSIKKLNESILPVVEEWYREHRPGKQKEIFKFYSSVRKEDKKYEIPKENKAIFNNLDKPYSDKRVILLVAVGTEGWDCRSLTAVALPRQKTTKNFVLQTTCRCLREVEDASKENALIYLSKDNYQTLDIELKQNYNLSISDLKVQSSDSVKIKVRKPKLGKLKYKQVYTKYTIVKKSSGNLKEALSSFSFSDIKKKYAYDESITKSSIGSTGLVREIHYSFNTVLDVYEYEFEDFIYDLNKMLLAAFTETEIINCYQKELQEIFALLQSEMQWISNNPNISLDDLVREVAALFTDVIEYKEEIIEEPVEIKLLEWKILDTYLLFEGDKFVPDFNKANIKSYNKYPDRWEQDFFDPDTNDLDPQNISFNYVPYKMDSDFERNAIYEMLKLAELKELEVYYNGYSDKNLDGFYIKTPFGIYTPDFLVIKRYSKLIPHPSLGKRREQEKT